MADPIALALIKRMLQEGLLDAADIDAIATEVEPESREAAHLVRCQLIEVMTTPEPEWRRQQLKVIDGGNERES